MKKLIAALMLTAAMPTAVLATDHIRIVKCSDARSFKDCAVIMIDGEIMEGDGAEFANRSSEIKNAYVILVGPGGALGDAVAIGKVVWRKKFKTFVPDNKSCASACALVWAGGYDRRLGDNAAVMFHSPFVDSDPTHADGRAAAYLGMYLAGIGYSEEQALNLVGHGPERLYFECATGSYH